LLFSLALTETQIYEKLHILYTAKKVLLKIESAKNQLLFEIFITHDSTKI